ncbi:unnamed protein product, partial [marine sediment metagenome]
KNKLTNDVRAAFHKVYNEMGHNREVDGKKITGHEAFLEWARDNATEFYRLYGKMIPATAELTGDIHEDFVDGLVFEEETLHLVEGQAEVIDVGTKPTIEGQSGDTSPRSAPDNAPLKLESPEPP